MKLLTLFLAVILAPTFVMAQFGRTGVSFGDKTPAALSLSTAAMQVEIDALGVSTETLNISTAALDAAKVEKAGDTMTGDLSMSGADILAVGSITSGFFDGDGSALTNIPFVPNADYFHPTDTDTGMFLTGSNELNLKTLGSSRLQIINTGAVKIFEELIVIVNCSPDSPSIRGANDDDSGICFPNNSIHFSVNAAPTMIHDDNNVTVFKQLIVSANNLGVGESAPEARLEVKAESGADFALLVSSADASHMMFITGSGHMVFAGEKPELSSCGTLPEIEGTDNGAHIIVGTAESDTCTITFAEPWVNKPICNCDDDTTIQNCKTVESPTTLILSGTWSPGDEIDFLCVGYR